MKWLKDALGAPGRAVAAVWRAAVAAAPVRLWAMILAGPPLTAYAVWLTWLIRYDWPDATAEQRLSILGYALGGALALIGIIVISLAAVKVKGSGPGGLQFEVDADDGPDEAPVLKFRGEATVEPTHPPADDGELPAGERLRP